MGKCRAGACPPLGSAAGHGRIPCANSPHETATPGFHHLVCRRKPGWVIGTKINRFGGLSLVIRGIPSTIRPPIRHSREGGNPEGRGAGGRFSYLGVPTTAGMSDYYENYDELPNFR